MIRGVMKRNRSAKSGKFVDKETAKQNPDTTVSETVETVPRSYITNSYIVARTGDKELLFRQMSNSYFVITIDGYAIVPLEEVEKHLENIKEMAAKVLENQSASVLAQKERELGKLMPEEAKKQHAELLEGK